MRLSSSSFPTGAPGTGLLLLRFGVAAALLSASSVQSVPALIAAAGIALALSLGFFSMIAALLAALMQLTVAFTADTGATVVVFASIAQALALALLGPGMYSIDARLFGRRLIFESHRQHRSD